MPLLTLRLRYPVTTPQFASMVGWLNGTLFDRCTIERISGQTSDGQGELLDAWADAATNVPCRLRSIALGQEATLGEQLTADLPWTVVLPNGQDVSVRDRIVITSMTPHRRFQVVAIPGGDSLSVATEVTVVELDDPHTGAEA